MVSVLKPNWYGPAKIILGFCPIDPQPEPLHTIWWLVTNNSSGIFLFYFYARSDEIHPFPAEERENKQTLTFKVNAAQLTEVISQWWNLPKIYDQHSSIDLSNPLIFCYCFIHRECRESQPLSLINFASSTGASMAALRLTHRPMHVCTTETSLRYFLKDFTQFLLKYFVLQTVQPYWRARDGSRGWWRRRRPARPDKRPEEIRFNRHVPLVPRTTSVYMLGGKSCYIRLHKGWTETEILNRVIRFWDHFTVALDRVSLTIFTIG